MAKLDAVLLAVVLVLVAGCGSSSFDEGSTVSGSQETSTSTAPQEPDPPNLVSGTPPGGTIPGDTMVVCSQTTLPFFAFDEIRPLTGDDRPEIQAAIAAFLKGEEGQFWPQSWHILHETEDLVTLVHATSKGGGQVSFMSVERIGDSWRWSGSSSGGSCEIELALFAELGAVQWMLDPDQPEPTENSETIHVLINELACASGQPVGDRLVGPQVTTTDSQVLLTFAARTIGGNCPSNPWTPFEVELPEPLGDRELVDGRTTGLNILDLIGETD